MPLLFFGGEGGRLVFEFGDFDVYHGVVLVILAVGGGFLVHVVVGRAGAFLKIRVM
jgi:hypothetical protein